MSRNSPEPGTPAPKSKGGFSLFWENLKFHYKGLILAAFPAIAVVVSTIAGFNIENQLVHASDLLEQSLQVRLTARRVMLFAAEGESAVRGYVLTGDERYLRPWGRNSAGIEKELADLRELVAEDRPQLLRVETAQELFKDYSKILNQLIEERRRGPIEAASISPTLLRSWQTTAAVRTQMQAVTDQEMALSGVRKERTEVLHSRYGAVAAGCLVLGVLGCIGFIFLFAGGIVRRIRVLEENARRLGRGEKLSRGFQGTDELGLLAQSLEKAEDLLAARNQDLAKSEERLSAIMEHSPTLIYIKDMDGRYLLINRAWDHFFEGPAGVVIGKTDFDLWPPNLAADYRENDARVIGTGLSMQFEETYPGRTGLRHYLSSKFVLKDECGKPYALCGICTDITERKLAEKEAKIIQERLSFALDGADACAWHWDLATNLSTLSDRCRTLLGIMGDNPIQVEDYAKIVYPDDAVARKKALDDAIREHKPFACEYRIIKPDGVVRWISSKGHAYYDAEGNADRMEGILMDITEKKESDVLLARARDEADRANNAKNDFLSRMSHELRTPLNSVLGFAQLLQMEDLSATQFENVTHILKGGKLLLHLIDEVLDISRIEAGKLALSLEPVHIVELMREAVDLLGPMALSHGISIACAELETDMRYVLGDRQRLKQVLINLLSNGIKYNRAGGSVQLTLTEYGDDVIRINVIDSGIGIPADLQERLFTPFDRLGAEQSDVEGTGLGLAVSKRLLEAMRSSLKVVSERGKGSTFYFDLPLVEPISSDNKKQLALEEQNGKSGHNVCVLYIEDNISNVRLMERILATRRPGMELLHATLGKAGFEIARRDKPDIILLDMNLPDAHGSNILNWLRQDEDTAKIPVIVVSADATSVQIDRLIANGAQAYIPKPYDIAEFLTTLDKFTSIPEA